MATDEDMPTLSWQPIVVGEGGSSAPLGTVKFSVSGLDDVSGSIVAGVFKGKELIGRTEAASKSGDAVNFDRPVQVNTETEATVSVYVVTDDEVSTESFAGSASVTLKGTEASQTVPLVDNDGKSTGNTLEISQASSGEEEEEEVKEDEEMKETEAAPVSPAPTGPLFQEDVSEGNPKYKSSDNDCVLGMKVPDLASLDLVNESDFKLPTKDQLTILVFWAQYHKPGYKFLPFYTQIQEKYGSKVCVIGVSTDPTKDYPEKFLEDPKKKYAKSGIFDTRFLIAHDAGNKLKDAFGAGLRDTLSLPHTFVVNDGSVVWHQDHSEHGATSPLYLNLMEKQLDAILSSGKAIKVGEKEEESDSESDSDSGGEMDMGLF